MNNPSPTPPPPYYYDDGDELTLKELILKLKEFGQELWKNIGWIILAGAIIGGIFYWRPIKQPTTYTTGLTFLVGVEVAPSANIEYSKIGTESVNYDLDKLVLLTRTNRIIHLVLFQTVIIGDKKDFLANHLINLYDFHEKWKHNESLKGFYFSNNQLNDFSEDEHRALNQLHDLVIGNKLTGKKGVTTISYEKGGMVKLTVTTKNSELSSVLIKTVFETLSSFYIEQTVGRLQKTYDLLENRAEIVKQDLDLANENLELELEDNYTFSLNNASESLTTLLQNVEAEKNLAIDIASSEKAFSEELLTIFEEQKEIALEKAAKEERAFRIEKEFMAKKIKGDLDLPTIAKIQDSFFVEEEKVYESILNYREALEQFNKEKALYLDLTLLRKSKSQEEEKLKLDSIYSERKKIRQQQIGENTANAANNKNNTEVRETLNQELKTSEFLRNKKLDLSLNELSREVEKNSNLYNNLLKTKQSLEFILKNRMPEFQIIDQTFLPTVNRPSKPQTLLGILLGSFLSIGFIIFRKIIRDALAE